MKFPVSGAQRHSLQPGGEVIKPESSRGGGRGRPCFLRRLLVKLLRAEEARALPHLGIVVIEP